MRVWSLLAAALLLFGCAGKPTQPAGGPIEGSPTVSEALARPEQVTGARVRWGGTIVSVENQADATQIEVVGRELDRNGKPRAGDVSLGRFLVRIPGFLDPEVYARGRRLTVTGTIGRFVAKKIGEYSYRFPLVEAERYHLWERERAVTSYPPSYPYLYDPFWEPGYPYFYSPFRPWHYGPYWPYW